MQFAYTLSKSFGDIYAIYIYLAESIFYHTCSLHIPYRKVSEIYMQLAYILSKGFGNIHAACIYLAESIFYHTCSLLVIFLKFSNDKRPKTKSPVCFFHTGLIYQIKLKLIF